MSFGTPNITFFLNVTLILGRTQTRKCLIYLSCSDDNIEVVKLKSVCWLDVRGKLKMSDLTAGITYKIVYVVKLTESSSGWELPMNLRLSVPGKNVQERQVSFLNQPKGQWTELNMGNVFAEGGETGEINFDIYEHGGHWKTGLIIKGVIIRPVV